MLLVRYVMLLAVKTVISVVDLLLSVLQDKVAHLPLFIITQQKTS